MLHNKSIRKWNETRAVVRGTLLAVEFIVDLVAQGWSETEMLRNYPVDENFLGDAVAALRSIGNDVVWIRTDYPGNWAWGVNDPNERR
jgi:hypothetical protein